MRREVIGSGFDLIVRDRDVGAAVDSSMLEIRSVGNTAEARRFIQSLDPTSETVGGFMPREFEA